MNALLYSHNGNATVRNCTFHNEIRYIFTVCKTKDYILSFLEAKMWFISILENDIFLLSTSGERKCRENACY